MKKTQFIELLANIRASWVSFASIVMFVALGIGLYSGLCWTGQDIRSIADTQFANSNFHTFEMTFPYGFTEDDIEAVKNVEGVSDAEAGYTSTQTLTKGDTSSTISVRSLTSRIDQLSVDEGSLPKKSTEIAINSLYAKANGISVGDTIAFEHDGSSQSGTTSDGSTSSSSDSSASPMKYLNSDTYTVTALVTSPAYLGKNTATYGVSTSGGSISGVAWVCEAAFNASAFNGTPVVLLVRCDSLDGVSVYSDEFTQKTNEIKDRISQIGESRAQDRYNTVIADAQKQIDESQAKLTDAQSQIDGGKQQLSEAESSISTNERQLEDAQLELDVTSKLLSSQKEQTAETLQQVEGVLEKYQLMYDESRARYDSKMSQFNTLSTQIELANDSIALLDASYDSLEAQKAALDAQLAAGAITQAEYDALLAQLCEEFNVANQAMRESLTTTVPDLYEMNKDVIDDYFDSATIQPATFDADLSRAKAKKESLKGSITTANYTVTRLRTETDELGAEMDAMKASLDKVNSDYATKKAEYEAKIASSESQVQSGQAKVDSGKQQLSDAKSTLESKRSDLASAEAQYQDGVAKLQDAKNQVSQTVAMNWTITPSSLNGMVRSTNEIVNMLYRLRFSMASLFVIVGLFVCYSAVSRIVHEQVTQLGTKKAIGFRNREITLSYLAYSGLAVLIGALLGIPIGMFIVEPILLPSMNQYVLDTPLPLFSAPDFLSVSALDLVLILLATWLACRGVLKRTAIELLAGEKPPSNRQRFYEKWNVWKRMGLFAQTVVNNCINDRRRVLATLVGVAGCTALIVAAITLDDNVNASFDKQTNEICTFDTIVYCSPDENNNASSSASSSASSTTTSTSSAASNTTSTASPSASSSSTSTSATSGTSSGAAAASTEQSSTTQENAQESTQTVNQYLSSQNMQHTAVQRKTFAANCPDGTQLVMYVYTPQDPSAFSSMFKLNSIGGDGGTGVLEGAWVTAAYANHFGAKVGDTIQLQNAAGQTFDIPIAGFFEYHSSISAMVLSESAYERIMGSNVNYNAYIANTNGADIAELSQTLAANTADYKSATSETQTMRNLSETFNKLSRAMVAIYIALSALMAAIVLLNLNVMFINEKKRELIVLMINGYSVKDAKRYIYRDTIVMAAVGILLGCLLGIGMGYLSVVSAEGASFFLLKMPSLKACLIGAALSAFFTALMTFIALRRIPKFELTDINKA